MHECTHLDDCVAINDDFDRMATEEEDDNCYQGDGGSHSLALLSAQPDRQALEMLESEGNNKEDRQCVKKAPR